jgi:type III secretory pathway lipoprotein EscJ
MKKYTLLMFIFLLVLSITSCRNNRLKTNEKELAKEIFVREQENLEAEKIAREKGSETKKSNPFSRPSESADSH